MKYVLFVCNHNAGRSQMAQAMFERSSPGDCRAESAGTHPARHVWPEVVAVMRELDIDISDRKPKRLSVEMQLHADWAVTMGCGDACPYVPTRVDDWDIPDPAGRPIDEVREIRDMIAERVEDLLVNKIAAIRLDATSHQWRLARLLPSLIEEFGATRSPEVIRGCADRILDDYDDAVVRTHILTLATKQARDCLRKERCAVLEPSTSQAISRHHSSQREIPARARPAAQGRRIREWGAVTPPSGLA
jgi:arsenate reductase